jgi:hypothetical protein
MYLERWIPRIDGVGRSRTVPVSLNYSGPRKNNSRINARYPCPPHASMFWVLPYFARVGSKLVLYEAIKVIGKPEHIVCSVYFKLRVIGVIVKQVMAIVCCNGIAPEYQ